MLTPYFLQAGSQSNSTASAVPSRPRTEQLCFTWHQEEQSTEGQRDKMAHFICRETNNPGTFSGLLKPTLTLGFSVLAPLRCQHVQTGGVENWLTLVESIFPQPRSPDVPPCIPPWLENQGKVFCLTAEAVFTIKLLLGHLMNPMAPALLNRFR